MISQKIVAKRTNLSAVINVNKFVSEKLKKEVFESHNTKN